MSCGESIETGDRRRGGDDEAFRRQGRSGMGFGQAGVNKDRKHFSMDVTGIISELRSEQKEFQPGGF
jgi:hypothetical protein